MMFYSRKHCFRVSETGEENYIYKNDSLAAQAVMVVFRDNLWLKRAEQWKGLLLAREKAVVSIVQ
jgi:hypothetical protein